MVTAQQKTNQKLAFRVILGIFFSLKFTTLKDRF